MRAGIYIIKHVLTNRIYIGSSHYVANRLSEHRSRLRHNLHGNPKLQRAWNRYGEADFEFVAAQPIEHRHELLVWEQFWIDILKPYSISRRSRGAPTDTSGRPMR